MKKIVLTLLLVVLMAGSVWAGGMSKTVAPGLEIGLIEMQVGTFWSRKDNKLFVGAEVPVIDYQNLISINVGTISNFKADPPIIAGINLNINTLAYRLGLGYHLPGDSQIGLWRGWDLSVPYGEGNMWGINWIIPVK